MSKTFKIVDGDISDGYHTFGELYDHRCLLFLNWCLDNPDICRWKSDPNTQGWFILYMEGPTGQISYHLPDKLLPPVKDFIEESPFHEWDGHTSKDVEDRLRQIAFQAGVEEK